MRNLYGVAIGFSAVAILSVAWIAWLLAAFLLPPRFAMQFVVPADDTLLIATLAVAATCLVVSMIVITSSILLGWREDRRQIEQLKLLLQQAEAQRAVGGRKIN